MTKRILFATIALLVTTRALGQETVLKQLKAEARSAPRDVAAQSALGQALLKAGRWKEAEQQLEKVARLRGNAIEARYDVVKVKFESGDYRPARAACRELSRENANCPLVHVCMARAFLVWKRSARAFEELDKALALDPENIEALLALGDAHRLRGSYKESQTAYQRVLTLLPNDSRAFVGIGRIMAITNRRAEAVEAFRSAIRNDPQSPAIQFELARLIGGDEGLTLLQQAVQGRPKWAEAEIALAELYLSSGKVDIAEKIAADVLKRTPTRADAYTILGRARLKVDNLQEAEKALRRALELVPNDPLAALTLANVLAESERYEEAFEQYRIAADLAPNDTEALVKAAELGMRLGRNALATGFLDRALERERNSAKILSLYADVLSARNDREQARRYYERALKAPGEIDRERIKRRLRELK
ncbi:MAG: tetratricopeptide repeat protein [Deltaproteobacteria bacterium]|nr:tetratricopeptide repeat protein [Deltaproteobacteria bacterium]